VITQVGLNPAMLAKLSQGESSRLRALGEVTNLPTVAAREIVLVANDVAADDSVSRACESTAGCAPGVGSEALARVAVVALRSGRSRGNEARQVIRCEWLRPSPQ
jgi:hypothetical protein